MKWIAAVICLAMLFFRRMQKILGLSTMKVVEHYEEILMGYPSNKFEDNKVENNRQQGNVNYVGPAQEISQRIGFMKI